MGVAGLCGWWDGGGVGVGYVCAKGVVGLVGALWGMQQVVEMLVMPTGGVL